MKKIYKEKMEKFKEEDVQDKNDWRRRDVRIQFTNSDHYSRVYNSGLGSYYERIGGIALDILNNIPTIAYNYEYKCHSPISLFCYMITPELVYQGVDIVLDQIRIKSGFPVNHEDLGEKEVIIFSKKQLFDEVIRREHDIINIVYPKNNPEEGEAILYYQEMDYYFNYVIRRFLYMKSRKAVIEAFIKILGTL